MQTVKTPAGRKERADNRGRERPALRQLHELLVEQPHEFSLIQTIDEPPHERSQIGCGRGDGVSMSRYIRQQQAADAPGGAARCIVNVPAGLRLPVRLAINPRVQPPEFDTGGCELASAPDFHALHALRGWPVAHMGIIAGTLCSVVMATVDPAGGVFLILLLFVVVFAIWPANSRRPTRSSW